MKEANRTPKNMLPELQDQCRQRKGGMFMDINNTAPETISGLPEYLQACIKAEGTVIIDLAGNVNLVLKPISK